MKLVIPMSGSGWRFLNAGYREPKPLIPVDGRPMIEHVLNLYPGETDVLLIANRDHVAGWPLVETVKALRPSAEVVAIAPHKLGPVYAVCQVLDRIPDDDEVIVSYCDFGMAWDYPDFLRTVRSAGADGAIPSYRGFHPHSLGGTLYAYARERGGWLEEIREKGHFTSNRMDEFASAGCYYFRRGRDVTTFFPELMRRNVHVHGEFYVSLVYNLLVEAGRRVSVYEVPRFLQWGTPEDIEDYQYWSDAFQRLRRPQPAQAAPVDDTYNLLLMAGRGQRFMESGYATPKPFIPVAGVPMALRAVRDLPPARRWGVVCLAEHLERLPLSALLESEIGPCDLIPLPSVTDGQAVSALAGVERLPEDRPVLIASCDNGMVWDRGAYQRLIIDPSVDVIVWTFRRHPAQARRPQAFGWVETDGTRALRVSVKRPLSDRPRFDHAVIGTFWFRRAAWFVEAVRAMVAAGARVNGEYYIDEAVNVCLRAGRRVRVFEVDAYLGWGAPEDLRTYEHWAAHFGAGADATHAVGRPAVL